MSEIMPPGFYNMDCVEAMKQFPDGFFDLAIVDPPYGIGIGSEPGGATSNSSHSVARKNRGGVAKIGGAKPFGKKNPGGGGVSASRPKATTRLTIQKPRMRHILTHSGGWQKIKLSGAATISLSI